VVVDSNMTIKSYSTARNGYLMDLIVPRESRGLMDEMMVANVTHVSDVTDDKQVSADVSKELQHCNPQRVAKMDEKWNTNELTTLL
jgi:hypothetical protein